MDNQLTFTREQLEAILFDCANEAINRNLLADNNPSLYTEDPRQYAVDKVLAGIEGECNCAANDITDPHCPACDLTGRIASRTIAGSARYIGEKVEW